MERAGSAGLRLLVSLQNEVLGTSYEQWARQRETVPFRYRWSSKYWISGVVEDEIRVRETTDYDELIGWKA